MKDLQETGKQHGIRTPVTQAEKCLTKIAAFGENYSTSFEKEWKSLLGHRDLKDMRSMPATYIPIPSRNSAVTAQEASLGRENSVSLAREHGLKLLLISVVLLLPCFWHRWLVAGDYGSHLYNAWLAQLIERGQAPGLWIAPQWNNVLFDFILSGFGKLLPLELAGRIAASTAPLLFFWGAFAFVAATTKRLPWVITPLLSVISYGWTFQEGLFNYYLSLGLAFWGLAFFWKRNGWERIVLLFVSPLILIAHPLGFVWFVGGALYIGIAEVVPRRFHIVIVLACAGVLVAAHEFLWHHYRVEAPAHSIAFYNGLDQLVFTNRYLIPLGALVLFSVIAISLDLWARRREPERLHSYLVPLQLYVLVEIGVHLLPDAVYWPQFSAPTSLLTERFTLISAVLFCCLLAAMKPHKWHFVALTAISVTFFSLLYQDTGALNRMEEAAWRLVHSASQGEHILVTIASPLKYRFSTKHIVEQACLGYCFGYGNYEASSTQFRIRASPGNRFVMNKIEEAAAMERGEYIVQSRDLPASQIYQCGPTWRDLCIHTLQAGERNDRLGVHPEFGIDPRPQEK